MKYRGTACQESRIMLVNIYKIHCTRLYNAVHAVHCIVVVQCITLQYIEITEDFCVVQCTAVQYSAVQLCLVHQFFLFHPLPSPGQSGAPRSSSGLCSGHRVQCVVSSVWYVVSSIQCVVLGVVRVLCSVCSVQCVVCSVYYLVCSVYCAVWNVQYVV